MSRVTSAGISRRAPSDSAQSEGRRPLRPAIPALRVRALYKRYGRTAALTDVALTVREGEVMGLIGPTGAGKTTLFECIAGICPADAGVVMVKDIPVSSGARGAHLFYLPNGIAPWPSERVAWALDFTIGFFGGDPARREAIVERLQIAPLLRCRIGRLSRAERKRVLLAIAMLTPHRLMLADQPFDGLDLRQSREVGAALREQAASGRTVFLSIHRINEAERVCDRFVLINAGRIRAEGTFEELAALARARGIEPRGLEEVVLALT